MPISPDHNTLFIHITRTGGTNLERILQIRGKSRARLWGQHRLDKIAFSALQHLTAQEMLNHKFLSPEDFERLFKFTIVKNPYLRCASLYHYWGGDKRFGRFETFVSHLETLDLDSYDHWAGHGTGHFPPYTMSSPNITISTIKTDGCLLIGCVALKTMQLMLVRSYKRLVSTKQLSCLTRHVRRGVAGATAICIR